MKDKLLALGVVVAVLFGFYNTFNKDEVSVNTPMNQSEEKLGGSVIPTNYQCIGGICKFYETRTLIAATTTPCRIKTPNATTTLVSTTFRATVGTSTASTVTLATTTEAAQYATTSLLHNFAIGSGQQKYYSYVGSTTLDIAASGNFTPILPPNTWIVYGVAGVSNGGFTYGGNCDATLQVMN